MVPMLYHYRNTWWFLFTYAVIANVLDGAMLAMLHKFYIAKRWYLIQWCTPQNSTQSDSGYCDSPFLKRSITLDHYRVTDSLLTTKCVPNCQKCTCSMANFDSSWRMTLNEPPQSKYNWLKYDLLFTSMEEMKYSATGCKDQLECQHWKEENKQ